MIRLALAAASVLTFACCSSPAQTAERTTEKPAPIGREGLAIDGADWPWWRGLDRNGIAAADQTPPLAWSETEHVLWKSPIPGRGHASPTVVGDQVFLPTADEATQVQSVLCYDRLTGKLQWKTDLHQGGLELKGNSKASQASPSIACDGERLFVSFLNKHAVYTTALDRAGKQLWQTKVSDYVLHQGYGASPALYGPLVIVAVDNKGGGAVAGLKRATGKIVWSNARPSLPNYSSPVILHAAGRDQLLLIGCDLASSFDPLTGKKLWEIAGATTECVTSTPTDGIHIYTSGGYPKNHVCAIRADGSGAIAWENTSRVYVPSMLIRDGYLYAVTDAGVAMCWNSATGDEVWHGRLGGVFSASPVMVGDRIYAVNEEGAGFVFKADPARFEQLAKNQLAGEVFASPVICGSRIFLRIAQEGAGGRQEFLYCLGEKQQVAGE